MKEANRTKGAASMTETCEYVFSSPAAARAAACVLDAQLKPFDGVKSRFEVKGTLLAINPSGSKEKVGTAALCAKRLSEWMQKMQAL